VNVPKQNEMKWNPEESQYELSLLLKQGYLTTAMHGKINYQIKIQIGGTWKEPH
jgi:hypothetical protein